MKLKLVLPRNDTTPDGYFNSSRDLIEEFKLQGITVTTNILDKADFTLVYGHPTQASKLHSDEPYGVYTMFESTKPPKFWHPYLKNAQFVVNPTGWGAKTFMQQYNLPIYTVPLAYSHKEFYYDQERPERKTFTFLSYNNGLDSLRKGFIELIDSFKLAFAYNSIDNVRLIVKNMRPDRHDSQSDFMWSAMTDGYNMKYINERYTREQLKELLFKADCFVFPSRGEGWGHTPLEAMATGLPAIIPNEHGISEYFMPPYCQGYSTVDGPAKYDDLEKGDYGIWKYADVPSLAETMRGVYEDREWFRDSSIDIARYAERFSYTETVQKLLKIIKQHMV